MLTRTRAAVALAALLVSSAIAYGAGNYSTYPIVGGASFCASTVTGAGTPLGGATGQGQGTGASGVCAQTVPAGPPTLTGNELIPMDTVPGSGVNPQTVTLPSTLLGTGYGGTTVATTTGTTAAVVVADGISNFIYAGAGTATYSSLTLPPNPMQNQKFCLTDAGTGVLTTTSIVVGTTGQTIVGTAVTSLPVATAAGTASTVTLSSNCWLYTTASKVWYRVL
jgi:hypothetical protein